jgi:hypothetical protein
MYINESFITRMLHDLLVDIKLDNCNSYRLLETTTIESACAQLEVAQLADILRKYTAADDMFTGTYLHGTNQNLKLMVDMGKAVDAPEMVGDVYNKLIEKEPVCYRCIVEVFKAWYRKTEKTVSPPEILPVAQDVSITDLKEQLNVP